MNVTDLSVIILLQSCNWWQWTYRLYNTFGINVKQATLIEATLISVTDLSVILSGQLK